MEYWLIGLAMICNAIYTLLIHLYLKMEIDTIRQRLDNHIREPELQREIDLLEEFEGPTGRYIVTDHPVDGGLYIRDTKRGIHYSRQSFRSEVLCKYLTEDEI